MAASTINTECKRYGCIKNLLACFANCRYVGRCDELRNELSDKTAQAGMEQAAVGAAVPLPSAEWLGCAGAPTALSEPFS